MNPQMSEKTAYLVRHGSTDMNNESRASEDRIRAWLNVPLNDRGRQEAAQAADDLMSYQIGVIVCSDLERAHETAQIMGQRLHVKVYPTGLLRPWNLGHFAGQPTSEVLPQLVRYAESPDTPVPRGESFNSFRERSFRGLKFAIQTAQELELAIVAHYRNERLFRAWDDCGQRPDLKVRVLDFLKKGEPPGGIWPFDINVSSLFAGQMANAQ